LVSCHKRDKEDDNRGRQNEPPGRAKYLPYALLPREETLADDTAGERHNREVR
jgi:hypothetical protein